MCKVARPGAHWWTPSRAHGWLPPVVLHPGTMSAAGAVANRRLDASPPVDARGHSSSGYLASFPQWMLESACGRILFGPHFGAGKFSKTLLQPVIAGLQRAGKVPNGNNPDKENKPAARSHGTSPS